MYKRITIMLVEIISLSMILSACQTTTPTPETIVVTEIVEVEGETVVKTVEVEVVKEVTPTPVPIPEFDPNKVATITVPDGMGRHYPVPEINNAFMQAYPNITVEMGAPWADSEDEASFLAKAATGELSCVVGGGDENIDTYGPRGILIDLRPYLERDPDLWFNQDHFLSQWIYENRDGAIYGLPEAGNPMVLWYNKDLLDAAGLEYPPSAYDAAAQDEWTWAKFREYAETLTTGDVWGVGVSNDHLMYWPFLYSNGARLINEEVTDVLADDPAVVETFDYLTGLVLDGLSPIPSQADELGGLWTLFQEGKIAMFVQGGWGTGNFKEKVNAGELSVGVGTIPWNTNKENYVLAPAVRMGISSVCEHPEIAYEWMKWFFGFEGGTDELFLAKNDHADFATTYARHDLWKQKLEAGSVMYSCYGPECLDLSILPAMLGPSFVMADPPYFGALPEVRDILLAELDLVYNGEQSLEDAMANFNAQADLAVLRFNR